MYFTEVFITVHGHEKIHNYTSRFIGEHIKITMHNYEKIIHHYPGETSLSPKGEKPFYLLKTVKNIRQHVSVEQWPSPEGSSM